MDIRSDETGETRPVRIPAGPAMLEGDYGPPRATDGVVLFAHGSGSGRHSPRNQFVARVRVLDDEGLAWVEEPTLAHDYTGHALIAREARTPIQCGENWWGTLDMQHAIEAQASEFVMPDVMKIGGVTGWLRAAALAQIRGIPLSNHLWPEISARLLCCTPTAHWLEYADWWNPILAEPLHVEKGMAIVGDAVGTGVDWNEDAVCRFSA